MIRKNIDRVSSELRSVCTNHHQHISSCLDEELSYLQHLHGEKLEHLNQNTIEIPRLFRGWLILTEQANFRVDKQHAPCNLSVASSSPYISFSSSNAPFNVNYFF